MRKSTLKLVLLTLFIAICSDAQSQVSVATATNHGNEQVVLLYTDDRALSLEPGKSRRLAAGDVVSTLAGGEAAVKYQDGCTLSLSGNQRLPINSSDQTIGCAQREALIQRIEVYAAIGATPDTGVAGSPSQVTSSATAVATAVATNPCRPGFRRNDGKPAAGKAGNATASATSSNGTAEPYTATGSTSTSPAGSKDDPTAAGPTAVAPTGGCTPAFITDNATGSLVGGAALLTAGIALSKDDNDDDSVVSPEVP